ncbi:MAG TPA: hypothetical protein VEC13_01220 [Candidatus Paceibacterota bacterium]|nr:hypothetical protein [Candidatus Paceibacterota bacterium]
MTGAFDLVRIPQDEYEMIDPSSKLFTHFNMEDTDVIPGRTYVLARIMSSGFFDHINNTGVDPVLSFENVYVCKCVSVENNIPYAEVKPEAFEFSMKHIKDISTLKDAIRKRYMKSMPKLGKEEIENLGVAIATHEIIAQKTFKFK